MDNNIEKKAKDNDRFRMIFMVILLLLLIVPLGFVSYDGFFNKETSSDIKPSSSTDNNLDDNLITSIKRITIDENEQVISFDEVEYKIKKEITVDGAFLLINNEIREIEENETAYADYAYVTNKFIIFTIIAQDGELISYAMDKNGNEIIHNDSQYQMHDIELVNGNIIASGHIFCGLDGDCPDKDLIIKYENNTITVNPCE